MVEMVEIDRRPGFAGAAPNGRATETLENGEVLYLPHDSFAMTNREHVFLDPAIVKQPRRHSGRARIIYLPAPQRLLKTTLEGGARAELQAMMVRFSVWAQSLVADLLPSYGPGLTPGPATFRPCPRSGPQRPARAHQHGSGRAPARLAVRRRTVRAVRRPPAAEGSPAHPRQRLAAGEARHHQGLPHPL